MATDKDHYDLILGIFRERNLLWVAEQVQEQVRTGKTISKKAISSSESLQDLTNPGSDQMSPEEINTGQSGGSVKAYISTEEYSDSEKVLIALRAVEIVTEDIWEIQQDIQTMLVPDRDNREISIKFIPDEYDEARSSSVSDFRIVSSDSKVKLGRVLEALKVER